MAPPETEERIVYLLGAGASVDAGLPQAHEMTKLVVERLNAADRSPDWSRLALALNFVAGAMVHHGSQRGARPDQLPDIESLVSAVELLSERDDLEVSPFVQTWLPGVDQREVIKDSGTHHMMQIRRGLGESHLNVHELERGLRGLIRAELGHESTTDRFNLLHIQLVRLLKQLLELEYTSPLEYLAPLVDLGRESSVCIATLNYDLTVETVSDNRKVPWSYGLDTWNTQWDLNWPELGIRLHKLHGSINWDRSLVGLEGENPHLNPPGLEVGVAHALRGITSDLPFVIFGRREKLRPEGPFLDLRASFAGELHSSTHLVVVGYSFGDAHINELVRRWLRTGTDRVLTVVDPNFPTNWAHAEGFKFELLSGLRQQAGAELNRILDSRLSIIRATAAAGIPQVTQGARHLRERLKSQLDDPSRSSRSGRAAD